MQVKPRIFISYCRSDGTTFATQLRAKLEKEHSEITLWQDVISEQAGYDWWLQITEALDQVEYMLLVLTPNAIESKTVRKEWRYARQQGVCVYPIQGSSNLDFNSLPQWIRDLHIDDIGYDAQQQAFTSTSQWQKLINHLNTPCQTPRVPFMVDDMADNFVERPHEFHRLMNLLRNEKREAPVAIAAALQGAGGFGKTTLARALCHDEQIQEAFDDGILWTTLGELPGDLTGKIIDLIEVLSGERPGFKEVTAASARLSELLGDRDILMVIDDVWDAAHLRPFLIGGKRCARLITTRNLGTLPTQAQTVNVDTMQQTEAIKLLATGLSPSQEQEEQLRILSKDLGEWPLLLRLANRVLWKRVQQQNQPLNAALNYVQKALAKHGPTAFDSGDPEAREQAVAKTVNVSLELLNKKERDLYVELAIFPEDTDVPLATIVRLWHARANLDELDAEQLCSRLHELSLLLSCDLNTRRVRLHDVMRRFLAHQMPASAVIHGELINAWGDLYHLPDEYAWRFLPYHLIESSRVEQLVKLLLDFEWMRNKLEATDITALVADYDYVAGQDVGCKTVQKALQLSAKILAKSNGETQLASQLLGRLLDSETPSVQALLEQLERGQIASFWLRPFKATLISPETPLLHTLEGHESWVLDVAITMDGAYVVSASSDHTVKIWEVKTGKLKYTLEGHTNKVRAVAITGDGVYVVSASADHTLKVWELETGKLLHTFEGHQHEVLAVAITRDSSCAISASHDKTLKVWELKTGKLLYSLAGHSRSVVELAITENGDHVVSASADHTLKVWELETGKLLHTLEGHSKTVRELAITWDGEHVVSASEDRTLKVWELKTGTLLHTLVGHNDWVQALALTLDGAYIVSGSADATLKIWELKTGKLVHTLEGHHEWVQALAITETELIVSVSGDKTLRVWDLQTGRLLQSLQGHGTTVQALAVTPDGTRVVSASRDYSLKIWELTINKFLHLPEGHSGWIEDLAITADGVHVVSASRDHTLGIWELKTGKLLNSLEGHAAEVWALAAVPGATQVVSASGDHTVKVWDSKAGTLLNTLKGHKNSVVALAVAPDGNRVISASLDHTLKVWELKTGNILHTLEGHSEWVVAVAITGDGAHVISASNDHTLRIWELETGKLLYALESHQAEIGALAIAADGTQVVSASYDRTLKVWEVKTGKLLHTLEGHAAGVWAVAVTVDGKHVVSASRDHTLKIWELKTGKLLHTLEGHNHWVQKVAISSDGKYVVSTSSDDTVKTWDLKTGQMLATFGAEQAINPCVVAPDGRTIIVGDKLNRVHFLRLEHPKER